MKCPHCNIPLHMTDRKGVEIDYCTQCRGVWLDRGELDKIIELSMAERLQRHAGVKGHGHLGAQGYSQHDPSYGRGQSYGHAEGHYRKPKYDKYSGQGYPYRKKKKGLLGEIFDIFD